MLRQPMKARWQLTLGAFSIALMLLAYHQLSIWQHQGYPKTLAWIMEKIWDDKWGEEHKGNPRDTTIPTWSQFAEGIRKMTEVPPRTLRAIQREDPARARGWLLGERWVAMDLAATAGRLFLGLGIGILGAVVLGLLMGCYAAVEALLVPPMTILAKIPPTAALAVFFVIAGTGYEMYVAMVAFGVLPTLALGVYLAVREIPDELLYKASTLGASQAEIIWNVILRSVLPKLIDAARLQIGPAMVYLIAAEMVCGDVGFGFRIRLQMRLLNMNVVYPYLAILAGFGFAMDYGLRLAQRLACPWYVRSEG